MLAAAEANFKPRGGRLRQGCGIDREARKRVAQQRRLPRARLAPAPPPIRPKLVFAIVLIFDHRSVARHITYDVMAAFRGDHGVCNETNNGKTRSKKKRPLSQPL
jgi:hypothetical protein